jgi:hypothetical protein
LFYLRKESLTVIAINSTNIKKTNNQMSYQLNRAKRCWSHYSLWWQSDSPIPFQTMVTFSFPVTCLSHTSSGLSVYLMWTPATSNLTALFYSYNHKMLRMEYSVLSYLSFRLSTEIWATYVDLNCSSCISFNG